MGWLRYLPLGDLIERKAWLQLGAIAAIALALVLIPVTQGLDSSLVNVLLFVAIYAVLSLGLNAVVGYTGLLDLGYATFLATGAVVASDMLLLTHTPAGKLVLPVGTTEAVQGTHPFVFEGSILVILLAAGLVCAVLGVLRGIPTLRLTGDYYAIVTLGIAEIFYLIYLNNDWLTGGPYGLKLGMEARPRVFGNPLYYDTWEFYFLVMGVLALSIVVMDRLNRSRIGRAWAAIRLDEVAARACGIDVSRAKMTAFAISGFFGGVGGALYAIWIGTVATKSLDIWQSILILCAVVLGGMGSIRGVLLGSLILFSLREALREQVTILGHTLQVPPEASFLVYGLLLIFVMRFRPQGILPRATGGGGGEASDEGDPAGLYALEDR